MFTPTPRPAPASISVQVDRLVLDGFDLSPSGERLVRLAVQDELGRLLSVGPLPSGLGAGGARRRPPGAPPSIEAGSDPVDLGHRIARGIHEGMGR